MPRGIAGPHSWLSAGSVGVGGGGSLSEGEADGVPGWDGVVLGAAEVGAPGARREGEADGLASGSRALSLGDWPLPVGPGCSGSLRPWFRSGLSAGARGASRGVSVGPLG